MYRFWFTYDEKASAVYSMNIYLIKWKGKKYRIHNVNCEVPIESYTRKTYPKNVLRGYAKSIDFKGDNATIR